MERAHFESELIGLKEEISRMARMAVSAVERSVSAFVNHRRGVVDEVLAIESRLNDLQMNLDDKALRLIALQQPTARDLRLILATVRANVDVERVGDHAVNLAHLADALSGRDSNPVDSTLVGMAETATAMLRDAVSAFITGDVDLARGVLSRDDAQDQELGSVFPPVIEQMRARPEGAERGVSLLLFARNLERIADHATNIAEQAIFLVEAKDVRHGHGE
jgi:phosphate transport system protein